MVKKIFIVFIGLSGVAHAQLDEFLNFQKGYPEAERRYRSRIQNIEGNCAINVRYTDNSTLTSQVQFALSGEYKKALVQEKVSGKTFDSVYSIGPSFGFNLVKESSAKDFLIDSIEPKSTVREAFVREFSRFIDAPFAIQSQFLNGFLEYKGFNLVRFDSATVGSADCWSLEFEFDRDGRRDKIVALFDKSLDFAIRQSKYQINGSKDTQIVYEVDYQESPGRHFFPKSVRIIDWDGRVFDARLEPIREKATPKEEFLLPFFGLPDITIPQRPGTNTFPTWLVMTLLAAVGLVVATILRRYANR